MEVFKNNMSKLLNRAMSKLDIAEMAWSKRNVDDSYVDDACFNIQQSMEMTLKYLIELSGNLYPRSHRIESLISALDNIGVSASQIDAIRDKAALYSAWEAESRYLDDFVALSSDVLEAMRLTNDLIEYAKSVSTRQINGIEVYAKDNHLDYNTLVHDVYESCPELLRRSSEEETALAYWETWMALHK